MAVTKLWTKANPTLPQKALTWEEGQNKGDNRSRLLWCLQDNSPWHSWRAVLVLLFWTGDLTTAYKAALPGLVGPCLLPSWLDVQKNWWRLCFCRTVQTASKQSLSHGTRGTAETPFLKCSAFELSVSATCESWFRQNMASYPAKELSSDMLYEWERLQWARWGVMVHGGNLIRLLSQGVWKAPHSDPFSASFRYWSFSRGFGAKRKVAVDFPSSAVARVKSNQDRESSQRFPYAGKKGIRSPQELECSICTSICNSFRESDNFLLSRVFFWIIGSDFNGYLHLNTIACFTIDFVCMLSARTHCTTFLRVLCCSCLTDLLPHTGLTSGCTPMYIAECAPTRYRGRLVTVFNSSVAGGQCVAGIVDGIFISVSNGWR